MSFPTCSECRRHVEEYRQAVLEREQMRQERDAMRARLSVLIEAAEGRVAAGHEGICCWSMMGGKPCTCGQRALRDAIDSAKEAAHG